MLAVPSSSAPTQFRPQLSTQHQNPSHHQTQEAFSVSFSPNVDNLPSQPQVPLPGFPLGIWEACQPVFPVGPPSRA